MATKADLAILGTPFVAIVGADGIVIDPTGDYPVNSTAITSSSGNVAAASAVATLAGAASKTTYITGFIVTAAGATAASVVSLTITGTIGGTMTFAFPVIAGANLACQPLNVQFATPVPASAANTSIVVTLPSLGTGNTNATVVATGYRV